MDAKAKMTICLWYEGGAEKGEMQITPVALTWAVTDPDPAVAKRAFDAMMEMKKIDITAIEAALRG